MKILIFLFVFFCSNVWSCENEVIAFKGINSQFDNVAFKEYVKRNHACSKIFEWHQTEQASYYINKSNTPYQLYGYSKGADSVAKTLTKVKRLPYYIITIGAWKTVDLDFTKWNISFHNYFDSSGKGQKSPGILIENVSHYKMQEHVNTIIWKNKEVK
jgi:hypothetical protein